jgi:hypothetical protein
MTAVMQRPDRATGGGAAPAATPAGSVSERLASPLRRVAGRARAFGRVRALLQAAVLLGAVWLVLALSLGSFRRVPVLVAILLALLAWGLIAFALWHIYRRLALLRGGRGLSAAAWLADAAVPDNQERISSAVELSQEPDARFRGSPELVAVLYRQAEKAADRLNPALVVSAKDVGRWFAILFPVLLTWLILLVAIGPRMGLGLSRGLMPWTAAQSLPGPTLVVTPGDATVAEGESLDVNVQVKPPATGLDADAQTTDRALLVWMGEGAGSMERPMEMERVAGQAFRTAFDNLQGSFSYKIQAAGTTAGPFLVHVKSRPSVARLRLEYRYPAYTHLAPRVDESREGSIDGLIGSRVTLTLDASEPIAGAALELPDENRTLTLERLSENPPRYTTEITLAKSGQYKLHLKGAHGLDNKDDQGRSITARPDAPPQVAVTAVAGATQPASLKVRPDDSVPIKYTASDDFGLTRLEGLVQVDDALPTAVPFVLSPDERRRDGVWTVSLADLLRTLAPGSDPKHVFYQLRATDNRDPDPQVTTTPRQMLEIDRTVTPLAQRQDTEAAHALETAIREAKASLEAAARDEAALQAAQQKPLTAAQKAAAAGAQQKLATARETLQKAADAANGTRLAAQAAELRSVAENPVRQGEESSARAALSADQPADRNASAAAAQKNISDALARLNAVEGALKSEAKEQPLAHALEDLANRQQQLAEAMAARPNDPTLKAEQQQLQQQLEKVIKDHPELQQPAADAQQKNIDALADKVRQIEQAQDPLNNAVRARAESLKTQEAVGNLARQQEALNREISDFAGKNSGALKQAGAKPPDDKTLAPIVKDLADSRLDDAAKSQKAAAGQLDQAAAKLDPTRGAGASPGKDAADLQDEAKQLASQIEQAEKNHNPPTRPSDPANQTARNIADAVKRAAQSLASNPAAKQAAADASKTADAAKLSANQGKAKDAQEQVQRAADKLAEAARAAGRDPSGDTAGAAARARELADKQQALADATAEMARTAADAQAAAAHPEDAAKNQRDLAAQIDQATAQAQALEKNAQGAAPDTAAKIAKAAQALRSAAQEQRAAAAATAARDPSTANSRQQRSAEALAQAEQTLTGQRTAPPAGQPQPPRALADAGAAARPPAPPTPPTPSTPQPAAPTPPTPQDQQPQKPAGQQSPQGARGQESARNGSPSPQGRSGQPGSRGEQSGRGEQSPQSGARGQQNAPGAQDNPPDARGQQASSPAQQGAGGREGASGQPDPQGTQSGQSPTPGQAAGGQPSTGQPSSGQSSDGQASSGQPSSGQPGGDSPAGQSNQNAQAGQGTSSGQGQPGAGNSSNRTARANGQTSAASGQPNAAPGQRSAPGGSPDAANGASEPDPAAMAQAVQAARNAQAQAASGNPTAAREAARQLAQASRSLSPDAANSPSPGDQPAAAPGGQNGPAAPDALPGPSADGSGGSGNGTGARPVPPGAVAAADTPKEVQEIGIAPSDWIRLSPAMQNQLLHAAQQGGPPSYRDMIKNYYYRIARLQAENGAP